MTSLHPVLSRSLWLGLGAAVLLVAGCANHPKNTSGITALSGAEQVPPVTTTASGTTDISARPVPIRRDVCNLSDGPRHVNTTGVAGTAAHFIRGRGPERATDRHLGQDRPEPVAVPPGTTLTDAQYQAYWDGLLYVNVHSDANKGGELRAQLKP